MTTSPDHPRPARGYADVDRELEEMLSDAERTVARLKAELAARRAQREAAAAAGANGLTDEEREVLAHAEVDRLDEHPANAKVRWSEVRSFFEDALQQLLGRTEAREGGMPAPEDTTGTAPADRPGTDGEATR